MAAIKLDSYTWSRIYSHSTFEEVNAAMCASKQWRDILQDEQIWRQLLKRDWGLSVACNTDLEPISSFRQSYKIWQIQFGYYGGKKHVAARMALTWKSIKEWYKEHHPLVLDTLLPGLSEEQIDVRLPRSGGNFPVTLRMFYRFCGGQSKETPMHYGLFGGASFYTDMPVCQLVPFDEICVSNQLGIDMHEFIPFAVIDHSAAMCCTCVKDQVLTHSQRTKTFLRASPQGKTFADWLDFFADRLVSGAYQVREQMEGGPEMRYVSLYPRTEAAGMREAITEGVRVRASVLFLPDRSYQFRNRMQYFYTYSIQFCLLPVTEQEAYWPASKGPFVPKTEVRLETRTWHIYNDKDELKDQVSGEGVVGFFPELKAGGEPWEYQSCTPTITPHASMDGYFTFTVNYESGRKSFINVKCPRFNLDMSDYSFL